MVVARRFLVRGRVQGVGFRWFAWEMARVEGLSGWVRNLADGTVEAVVEGEADAVDRFARHLARGPVRARVEAVAATDVPPSERVTGFEIR